MSSEWPVVSISELVAPEAGSLAVGPFGSRMKADLYVPSGVRVIRGNNLSGSREPEGSYVFVSEDTANSLASCCLKPGDLVFPHRGNIGEVGITPNDGHRYMLSTSLMKLSPDRTKVSPLFLMYFFKSAEGRAALLVNTSQVGTPGIATPLKSLRGITLRLPPLALQNQIAEVLSKLDDRITLLRETNATLEAIAQALFKSWFVDFDPVRAKMEGRAPEGMDEATAALFPDSFEESNLGLVPKGWRVGTLDEVAALNPEGWSAKHHPSRILYVDLSNTKANQIEGVTEYDFHEAPSRARRVLRIGDVLVGTVRPGNRSFARISVDRPGLTGSTAFAVFRAHDVCDQALVYIAATRDEAIERLVRLADGGAYPAVRPEVVAGTTLVIPPQPVREAFGEVANSLLASVGSNQEQCLCLSELRDTLLPRLISGQLRLPEAQDPIEETC